MDRTDLIEQLTEDIFGYAMHGRFPEQELAAALKPDGLDARFTDYERLLNLHFVLLPEVVEFVEELPQRVRELRTETESVSRRKHGIVDGNINWGATINQRYSQNPGDRSIFICENRTEDYDTAENLVFKRLIATIHETLREADDYLKKEYKWVRDRWDQARVNMLRRIVEQNVHIRRIRDPKAYEPTDRMVNTALESRHEVYREAAELLQTHQQLFAGDKEQLERLLRETAITPDDDETLFELYVLFRFIATLDGLYKTSATFETLETGRQEVACLAVDGGTEIIVYHDNSARDQGLSFLAVPEETDDGLSRTEKVHTTGLEISNNYFQERNFQNQTGRPDLIVLQISHDDGSRDYLVTEVKNSTKTSTIRQGIKETLEYLAFMQQDDHYVFGTDDPDEEYFGDGWNGLLVIQDLTEETASLEEQADGEINILQASELEENLETILTEIV